MTVVVAKQYETSPRETPASAATRRAVTAATPSRSPIAIPASISCRRRSAMGRYARMASVKT